MSKFSKLIKNPNAFFNDSPAYQAIKLSLLPIKSASNFQKNVSIESLKNDISSLIEIVVTKESFLKRSLHIGILKGSAHSIYNF
ncbi:hypothetical protein ABK046_44985, partial [Streptomyces caeruleatus]